MLNRKLSGLLKEQVISKVLFLCLVFFVTFAVIYVVDRVQLNYLNRYDREIENQQARSELGKAIMHRLLMVELGIARMIDTTDLRKVEVLNRDIHHSFSKLEDILSVLQGGGTFKNTFPANFYDRDEVDELISFHREKEAGYVLEVIDLNPKIYELEVATEGIYSVLRKLLGGDESPTLKKVHDALNFRVMQIEALILRARESSSKIFHETQTEIKRLSSLKEQATAGMNNFRLGVIVVSIPLCLFIFFRIIFNIRSILDDRETKARNLEEAKSAIEIILDSIPVGMVIVNENREVIKANSEALRLFGAESEEKVLGNRCDKVFCFSSEHNCPFSHNLGASYENEVKIKTAAGKDITVLKNAAYITLSGERLVLEAFMDISQRSEMERRLKDQQDYTNAVLQGVQAGVVVIAADTHTIADMNETAARLIGVNREEALGTVCHKYICPAEVGKCPVTDLGQDVDHAVRRLSNGKSILKSVVPFKRGEEAYLLESFVDITDRVSAEEQLKDAMETVDAASKAKSEFLSRMGLKLSTPLNTIVDFSDALLRDDDLTGKMRSDVDNIASAGHHLKEIISEVLDFSMVESERSPIDTEEDEQPEQVESGAPVPTILCIDDDPENINEMRKISSNWNGFTLVIRETVEKGLRAVSLLRPDIVLISDNLAGDIFEQVVDEVRAQGVDKWKPFVVLLGDGSVKGADSKLILPVTINGVQQIVTECKRA
ncbi:PAS domain-containing protein [Maridesulfovibrio salexigens]|uniref:histidine kinase n=1 Tax=Maridesulfovibrio salexigens (strain ATCC 14822 / DSM 2638 / NCIMB 8403 / VKM B-1763) TaxID=526222 RepID=C6BYT9_MARSD|nr:PAS domain-containing protein [Maridesulfovibrio salexigens]ACS80696.1 putative PAS/PAC sensor protein [Maridesulfovibrio salexigens DSM 2638]